MITLYLDGSDLAQLCRIDPHLGVELLTRILKLVAGQVKATEERFAEICGISLRSNGSKSIPLSCV